MGPVVFLSSSSHLKAPPELKKETERGGNSDVVRIGAAPLTDCSFVTVSFDPLGNRYGQVSSRDRPWFTDGGDGDAKGSGDVPRVSHWTQGCEASSLQVPALQHASS